VIFIPQDTIFPVLDRISDSQIALDNAVIFTWNRLRSLQFVGRTCFRIGHEEILYQKDIAWGGKKQVCAAAAAGQNHLHEGTIFRI
jgi:hypothetical protein